MRPTLIYALSLVFISNISQAGVLFEIETHDYGYSPRRVATTSMAVEDQTIVIEIEARNGRPGGQLIYRGDREEMVVTDDNSQSYLVLDARTIRTLAMRIEQTTSGASAARQHMPSEQQASFTQTSSVQIPGQFTATRPPREVRCMDDPTVVNGYPCDRYEVWSGARKVQDVWATDWVNLEKARESAPAFYALADFFRTLTNAASIQGGFSTAIYDENMYTLIIELNAFPVACQQYAEDGAIRNASILRNAWPRSVPPVAFEPPPNYRRQEMLGTRSQP